MLKWIFISIGILLITSLGAVYFHVRTNQIITKIKLIQYRNKHAKNPLDELKKGLGNGTIDKAQYFDVQNQLTLHKEKMEADGKFFNADGYAINVPESVPEESELDETAITETDVSTVATVKETEKAKS